MARSLALVLAFVGMFVCAMAHVASVPITWDQYSLTWELQYRTNQGIFMHQKGKRYYDEPHLRQRDDVTSVLVGSHVYLEFYDKNPAYQFEIDLTNKQCTKGAVNEPLVNPLQPPANATLLSTTSCACVVGNSSNSHLVDDDTSQTCQTWTTQVVDGTTTIMQYWVFNATSTYKNQPNNNKNAISINNNNNNKAGATEYLQVPLCSKQVETDSRSGVVTNTLYIYSQFTGGQPDESLFSIPSYCHASSTSSMRH